MKLTLLALCLLPTLPALATADWKNESALGIVINHGNSHSQSLNAKQDSAYLWDKNTVSFLGNYLKTSAGGKLSAKRWDTTLKYERSLSAKWSLILAQGVESDRFAGYLQRYNTDVGPKYYFYQEEKKFEWFAEAGYRYTRERRTNGTRESFQKGRLYTEMKRDWNESAHSKFWVEYLPNFSETKGWQLNSELSTSANLNKTFAVQVAYLYKLDNAPKSGANKKHDGVFTTSLVAKY